MKVALKRGMKKGRGMAKKGVAMGIISLLVSILLAFPASATTYWQDDIVEISDAIYDEYLYSDIALDSEIQMLSDVVYDVVYDFSDIMYEYDEYTDYQFDSLYQNVDSGLGVSCGVGPGVGIGPSGLGFSFAGCRCGYSVGYSF